MIDGSKFRRNVGVFREDRAEPTPRLFPLYRVVALKITQLITGHV